jgi:hybrid cluster-associated redox disulfide protein
MQNHEIHAEVVISELLRRWPQTIPVFQKHKMACVGCSMSDFETVSSAAEIYQLSLGSFIEELHEAVQQANNSQEDRDTRPDLS